MTRALFASAQAPQSAANSLGSAWNLPPQAPLSAPNSLGSVPAWNLSSPPAAPSSDGQLLVHYPSLELQDRDTACEFSPEFGGIESYTTISSPQQPQQMLSPHLIPVHSTQDSLMPSYPVAAPPSILKSSNYFEPPPVEQGPLWPDTSIVGDAPTPDPEQAELNELQVRSVEIVNTEFDREALSAVQGLSSLNVA
eukprot:2138111-Rhodomonas_salina.3